ncbi:MerR family transcriptional regulator [Streptomyces scopuliridis]|uniref:MerR family transcriptional regulator n=1 Tax=Streptomyces scopuliridis TaxID=452529 RepID=UPI0036ACD260
MAKTITAERRGWLTIQDVSRRSGLSEPTLRYYEKIGLIEPVDRDDRSGHRQYAPDLVTAIEALSCLRSTGMSVRDMHAYQRHLDDETDAAAQLRELFERNAERVADEIERLQVRLRYLRLKAELWAVREQGDISNEGRVVDDLTTITTELR